MRIIAKSDTYRKLRPAIELSLVLPAKEAKLTSIQVVSWISLQITLFMGICWYEKFGQDCNVMRSLCKEIVHI